MTNSPGLFIDWSQLASELTFEGLSRNALPLPEPSTHTRNGFADLLNALSKGTHQEVIQQIELQLQVANQTLSMLEGQTFEVILRDLLNTFTLKVGEILNADRTAVFLVDQSRQELWSIVTETDHDDSDGVEIRLPWHQGIAGEVARTKNTVKVPFDFYDDPRSEAAKQLEAKIGYRTYTLMALPVLDRDGKILAVVEVLNKRLPNVLPGAPLGHRIDINGFSKADEDTFAEFGDVFRLILESSQSFFRAAKRQQSAIVLVKAIQALNHRGTSLSEAIQRINKEARFLLNADQSDVWLLDSDRGDLWTEVTQSNGSPVKLRTPLGESYVGKVAQTGTVLNLTCDVYDHTNSNWIREIDQRRHYRTYSLLCTPVSDSRGNLIAVVQLANKYRSGLPKSTVVSDSEGIDIPTCFKACFTDHDEFLMLAFNIHVGNVLERAMTYETLDDMVISRTKELQEKNQRLQFEINERKKVEERLQQLNRQLAVMARKDALTQIANRREFNEHLDKEWKRMRRNHAPLSLLLCDIDYFKRYNDRYGHLAGDNCLREVATAIAANVKRPADLAARYGGEEFAVILPETDSPGAMHVAESIRQSVAELGIIHEESETARHITLSIGTVTLVPTADRHIQNFINKADSALYEAKRKGRNRVELSH